MAKLGELISQIDGRLTLTSGVPVTTSDVTAATTIYFTPYKGNHIALYNEDFEDWRLHNFTELSYSLAGIAADTNFDVFVYNNAGTLSLEIVAWSDATTRATALAVQDGVYVKSGAFAHRFLGAFRTTSTIGQCEDSQEKRFVSNFYNTVTKLLYASASAEHTYNSTTRRPWNNDSNNSVHALFCVSRFFSTKMTMRQRTGTTGFINFGYTTSSNDQKLGTCSSYSSVDWEHYSSGGGDNYEGKVSLYIVEWTASSSQTFRQYFAWVTSEF